MTCNPSTAAVNLGEINTSNSGIFALDSQVSSLSDMFRFFKVNKITFEWIPNQLTAGTAVGVPPGVLYCKMQGQSAPSTLADLETPYQSWKPSLPWTCGTTPTGDLVRENIASLTMKNKDFAILQGPSEPGDLGYLTTQDDGTQTSYGTLFWLFFNTVASTTLNYVLRTYFNFDFKDILDPASVSAAQAERAAAAVSLHCQLQVAGHAYINFADGTLERAILLHTKVNRPLSMTPANSPMVASPSMSGCGSQGGRSNEQRSGPSKVIGSGARATIPGSQLLDLKLRLQNLISEAEDLSEVDASVRGE